MKDVNPAYLALIPLAWCCISFALSRLSGWHRLARAYPAKSFSSGPTAFMRSGTIGAIKYYSCLMFRASDEGLSISVAFPLRLGHRPMFIPWNEFHQVIDDPALFSHKVRVSIGNPTMTRIVFPGWVKYHMPHEFRSH